ncbi:MAG: response regulator, partial [Bacteroidales bacterium]|nr:response regulator [Bacteroidales bacterium]
SNEGMGRFTHASGKMQLNAMRSAEGVLPTSHDLVSDNQGRLWVATMGFGLFCYDHNRDLALSINAINPDIQRWVTRVYAAADGRLWLGTYDGLECINIHDERYPNERYLKRTIVYDIKADAEQRLWLATSAGLFQMSQQGDTLLRFTTQQGMPSQSVSALQIDHDGIVWATSNRGLSRVDPKSGHIVNFYSGDGLQGNEFCKNASMSDHQGRLWFGGSNGVTFFQPNEVRSGNHPWHVRLLGMTLNGQEVSSLTRSGNQFVTEQPMFMTERVELDFEDNAFSLFFGTEELNCPETMQFEYSLNSQPWQRLPVGVNSVSFSNLASGKYLFEVRAVNNQRDSTVCSLAIDIRPQWYQTWWARVLFVAVALLFLVLVVLTILSHYRSKNERMLAEKQEAMHDAQTRFFIDLTHEIRTPLMLILSPVRQLIAADKEPLRLNSYLTIQRNANRILRLMEQMIDLRKADKGVLKLHFSECNVIDMLGNVYADFLETARLKQIDFTFEHEGLDQLALWVDANYFDKIVINLISNALKYTQSGGRVLLRVCVLDALWAQIDVIDNGPGIAESEQERIFERFYRSSNATEANIQGSGIGLDLTRTLVERHHGRIQLTSSTVQPSGSTFSVILPLGNSHLSEVEKNEVQPAASLVNAEVQPAATVSQRVASKTKYHILIADDEPEMLAYLQRELSPDFHVRTCTNGEEALYLLQREKFTLVISDVMMPKLDGVALCRKLRQNIHLNHLPVILLTANTEEQSIIRGIDSGADEYMVKPVSIEVLRSRVYNLIRTREMLYNNYVGRQLEEDKLIKLHEKTPDEQLMERVMRVINTELANPDLTVEMLADRVGLSRVHLNRKLKELTNQTVRDFIRNVRLRQAALLLSQGNVPVSRVAEMVGYANPGNFTSAFQALYGVCPKDYRGEKELKQNVTCADS